MIINLSYREQSYNCDLSRPIDISIPIGDVKCFYASDFKVLPFKSGDFIGSVREGAPVNFYDVSMNPHGHGTHTECLGHITRARESINDHLLEFHFIAQLVSVTLEKNEDRDSVITAESLASACPGELPEALIIRTYPNPLEKMTKDYSGTNPPFLEKDAMAFIVHKKVKHLLLDLPSVDREMDEGKVINHRLFWNLLQDEKLEYSRIECTITELIYIKDKVKDGMYLLNLQIPSLKLDAAPSKPVIYPLFKE